MSSLSPLWSGSVPEVVAGQPLFDAGGWLFGLIDSTAPEPVLVALLSVGFVGMSIKSVFDSILSDEEAADPDETGEEGGLMPEEGGDDFGELGGLDDGGEEFGEFEDDEFGEMDGGPDTDELEHRLDELETEVGSLSSTVNTVRNENEQISETVDDVEENVRKLLDIYEMVTRGVNPFADDIDAGGLGGEGESSFGLFNDDGGDSEDELEEDIANADAEGFFDEDLVEDEEELEADADVGDVLGGGDADDAVESEFDDEFDDSFDDGEDFSMDEDFDDGGDFGADEDFDDGGSESDDSEGGKSFAELKDEYESGDAEWAEGEEPPAEAAEEGMDEVEPESEPEVDEDGDAFDELESESAEDALADDDLFDTVIEDDKADELEETTADDEPPVEDEALEEDLTIDETEAEEEATADPDPAMADDGGTEATATNDADTGAADQSATSETDGTTTQATNAVEESGTSDDGKPYLTDLPDGFLADLIVVEWLEFLVDEVGVRATSEAIHYYERIDWIDEDVADQLQAYLRGFEADGERATLTIDHHTESLRYVSQLNGGGAESIAMEQLPAMAGGGSNGLQR